MGMSYFSPQQKKVIFFDLNRTLIDYKRSYQRCFVEVLEEFAGRWERDDVDWQPKKIASQYMKTYNSKRWSNNKKKPSIKKRRLISMRTVLKPYPFIINDDFVRQFFRRMNTLRSQHYELHPQATVVLTKLQKSYQLGLISNNRRIDLEQIGLSSYFTKQQFITPPKGGHGKPHPTIYRHALQVFGVKASDCVMIGDSWKRDIVGATRAGLDAIWINPLNNKSIKKQKIRQRKVIVVSNLKQVPHIFSP